MGYKSLNIIPIILNLRFKHIMFLNITMNQLKQQNVFVKLYKHYLFVIRVVMYNYNKF